MLALATLHVGPASGRTVEQFAQYDVERRAADIFEVGIPGETYGELGGSIGHRASDMTLAGDGLLAFDLVRQYEEVPHAYPYELGTMSLKIPTLSFEVQWRANGHVPPTELNCERWKNDAWQEGRTIHSVRNSIRFDHESGTTQLQSVELARQEFRTLFPGDALYVSTDFHYLTCDGRRFVIHSPDGSRYVFTGERDGTQRGRYGSYDQNAAESFRNYVLQKKTKSSTKQGDVLYQKFDAYRMYAVEKRRHTSRVLYFYEAAPAVDVDGDGTAEVEPAAFPPVRSDQSDVFTDSSGSYRRALGDETIENKVRLRSVWLDVAGRQARKLELTYRGVSESCPGLLKEVTSTASRQKSVRYVYRPGNRVAAGDRSSVNGFVPGVLPRTGCVLEQVIKADGSM